MTLKSTKIYLSCLLRSSFGLIRIYSRCFVCKRIIYNENRIRDSRPLLGLNICFHEEYPFGINSSAYSARINVPNKTRTRFRRRSPRDLRNPDLFIIISSDLRDTECRGRNVTSLPTRDAFNIRFAESPTT